MRNETREKFNAYLESVATGNGIPDATQKFAATPSVQQRLETNMQESSGFLSRINITGVVEQTGEKLGLGIGGPIASRTDTDSADRQTSDPTALDDKGYACFQTNYDTHIKYSKLDAWAKFPDFAKRIRDVIVRRMALDRIMIGFNGVSRAADTNIVTYPLLQDVNKGWLQKYRDDAPSRVLDEVVALSGVVNVGATGDYKNLDALVMDVVNAMIEPWYQDDTALVCLLSRDLLHDKYFPLVDVDQAPTEKLATDLIISQKRVGGLPAVRVPFVPTGTLMVTTLDNLSIYYQEGARRRKIEDNAKRDRIENYESSNDDFVVEDYGRGCVVENITLV